MMNAKSHTAFSLIELLVSIGIVAIITGLSMAAYGKFTAQAQKTRCVEFVHQVRTALEQIYQGSDGWPPVLQAAAANGDGCRRRPRTATAGSTQRRARCSPRAGCR